MGSSVLCWVVLATVLIVEVKGQTTTVDCLHGDVRLVQYNNALSYRGRVELCVQGVWGTVTDDGWDSRDARVVCRQLGYSDLVVRPYPNAWFGQGTGLPIHRDNIRCSGNEAKLINCPFSTPIGDTHGEDASVRCYTEDLLNSTTCNTGDIQLIGGNSAREGRLQLCFGGQWSTVTDDGFSTYDAMVVCRMLGYQDGYGFAYSNAFFGAGSGFISMDNVGCFGSPFPLQQSLFDCSYVMAVGDSHAEDVGIKCFDTLTNPTCNLGDLRLMGGSNNMEGRVEICVEGVWGTISDDGWSSNDAQVACRQLGFAALGAFWWVNNQGSTVFGQGSGPIQIKSVGCNGRNLKLIQCNFNARTIGESHSEDAAVRCMASECTEADIRLVNGSDPTEGRVEFCFQGTWIVVCDLLWSIQDAQVACDQLGYANPSLYSFAYTNSYFGRGTVPIRVDELRCLGNEDSLLHCPYSTFISTTTTCTDNDAAGLRCTPGNECTHGTVKLVDGPGPQQGRLEICLYGIWGTVSHNAFGFPDARVVCRQLGYYDNSGSVIAGAFYGQGTGLVHARNVGCIGNESSIFDCTYSRDTTYNPHTQDVSVRCQIVGECVNNTVRLASASDPLLGRLDVCVNGVWSIVVSTTPWSGYNSRAFCRQLGFDFYAIPYGNAYVWPGYNSAVIMENVRCQKNMSSVFDCEWEYNKEHNNDMFYDENMSVKCFNVNTTAVSCTHGSGRIVGGTSVLSGRAEICLDGQWGTVCNTKWTDVEANVFCGQAGHAAIGATAVPNGTYSLSAGSIWLGVADCSGDEDNIMECMIDGRTDSCSHDMDVGVVCQQRECEEWDVRIVNGSSSNNGRVEVCRKGRYGTICGGNWGTNEARVICNQLGLSTTNTYGLKQAPYGRGTGQIWLNNIDCVGNENRLEDCVTSFDVMGCDHSNDVGVLCTSTSECTAGDVRLVGGTNNYNGQVQVCYEGVWGTVASDGWDSNDALVVCRQLGYPEIIGTPVRGINYGSISAPIVMGDVACTGTERKLIECTSEPDNSDHTYSDNAGVRCYPEACSNGAMRLIGGSTDYEGTVELCLGGEWGTIGNAGWNTMAASVVCRALFRGRYMVQDSTPITDTSVFGASQDPVILSSVTCTGSESSLLECDQVGARMNASHSTDAGVRCAVTDIPVVSSMLPTGRSVTTVRTALPTSRPVGGVEVVSFAAGLAVVGIVLLLIIIALVVAIFVIIMRKKKSHRVDDTMNLVTSASFDKRP